MADEPRRSGRATKGQHTKNAEESGSPEAPKSRGKGKASKKSKADEEPADEEGGETESILCLCQITNDDDEGRNFLCCDQCETWQHNDCMGLPAKYNPEKYFCWRCRPEDHPEIVEALNNGEKPEDVAARMRSKKGPRKGRQSLKPPVTATPKTETPTPVDQNKRKHTSEENGEAPAKRGKSSTPAQEPTSSVRGRRKKGSAVDEAKPAESIAEIQNAQRKKTAEGLRNKFSSGIASLVAKGTFTIPEDMTVDTLAEEKAIAVEHYMFANLCNGPNDFAGAYGNQLRTIIANVGQNLTLCLGLMENSITPEGLSTMTSGEMATEEQKKLDEKMKKDGEKQAMMVQETGPRIRRTHKGEELVEDSTGLANESITSSAPPRRMLSNQDDDELTPTESRPMRPPSIVTANEETANTGRRRSSSNFNMQNIWSSVQSPTAEQRQAQGSPQSASHHPAHTQQRPDADIDRLLEDDGMDSAPYSPAEASLDPHLVWRGQVDMPVQTSSIAQFSARAYHMAGSELGGKDNQTAIFPKDLVLAGRIAADKADQYLTSLSAARFTDVSVFELIPAANDDATKAEFSKLFTYLKQRQRYGVIGESLRVDPVKDMYIVPLNQGNADTPQFITRLDYNLIEESRTRQMLLVVFVLRYKDTNSLPLPAPPATPSAISPTGPSHGGGGAPAMSPTAGADGRGTASPFPAAQQQQPPRTQYSFPSNPYAPGPAPVAQPQPQAGPPSVSACQQQNRDLAARVLGDLVNAPVAQSILATASTPLSTGHLQSLRQIFEDHPSARADMQEVQRILGSQSSAR